MGIPIKMTAGLMYGPKDVRIEHVETPTPEADEVLVKVESCGICATDVKKYTGRSSCKYPIILGHEFAGTIVKVGKQVKNYNIGDRVTANPDKPCMHCRYCVQSKYNLCENLSVIGYGTEEIEPVNGAFAQYVKVPTWNLIPIEKNVGFDEATFVEPLACVVRSLGRVQPNPDDLAVILGEGRIGLLHIQLAKEMGVDHIIVTGLIDSRLKLAKKLGADEAININSVNPLEFLFEHNSEGANIVIDTTGNVKAAEQGIKMLAPHGRFVAFAGFPKNQEISIDPRDLHYKEIVLTGSFGYGSLMDYYTAGHLIAQKRIDVKSLITSIRPLTELEEGFKEIAELRSIRTIIRPQD
ncbi:MAG: alcohol dehydrogenase catalytic domain-containing protein [Candidatus Hodarchaeales archaeon]